jgi:LemA protein
VWTKPDEDHNLSLMGLYIFLALAAVLALWGVSIYNGLVRRRTMVEEGWSGIETQLKRRANLIPNLVETVKGYASHERATLDELTKLRSMAQASGGSGTPNAAEIEARAQTERQISAMIGKVMAVAEAYPDLKASANFQSLQNDLSDIEDQIQLARRYYNGAVRNYNVMTEQVPSNIIANWFAFQKANFLESEDPNDRAVPEVSFS